MRVIPRWLLGVVAAVLFVAALAVWLDEPPDSGGPPNAASQLFDRALLLYADGLDRVAGHYLSRDMNDSAEVLLRRALMARQAALGPRHQDVAASLDRYVAVLVRLGRDDEARAATERAARIRASASP